MGIQVGREPHPPTTIDSPFQKATIARATTKMGTTDETRTTRLSAARRSRNSHKIPVSKRVSWAL